jgi:formate-dependent nitrite reductase membrane component NrfD
MPSHEWGFLIASNLFLGGLSAGLFLLSAIATLRVRGGESPYPLTARFGALLAPWPVMIGTLLLTLDLGHWYRFYKLMLHFRWQSPMSIGSWLLTVFINVSLLFCWTWLDERRREAILARVPKRVRFIRNFLRSVVQYRGALAIAGIPLSLAVATYTGVLLGVMPSRPFWNTSLIAQLFLVSAVSAACALLIVIGSTLSHMPANERKALLRLDGTLLCLEVVVVIAFLIYGWVGPAAVREAASVLFSAAYGVFFWVLFVGTGVLVPLAGAVRELQVGSHSRRLALASASLLLTGAFVLRCVTVFAGQAGFAAH